MRKRKLSFSMLSDMLAAENNGYYDYSRVTYRAPDGKMIPGYIYRVEKQISPETLDKIITFSNVKVTTASHRYAPEIKKQCVFIADRCFII